MTQLPGRFTHLPSTASGLLMATAAGVHTAGGGFLVAILAALVVLVGISFRLASGGAVLLAAAAVALSDAQPLVAGLAGLSAACYLLLRYNVGRPIQASRPALIAALGFTVAGVVVAAVPLELPWLPLLAPPAVFAAYLLAIGPFLPRPTPTATPFRPPRVER